MRSLFAFFSPSRSSLADRVRPRRFVPQANRALRPFNIFLNTRHKSRWTRLVDFFSPSTSRATANRNSVVSPSLSHTPSGRSNPSNAPSSLDGAESPRGLSLSRQTSASSIRSATSFRSTGALHSATPSPSVSPSSSPPSSPPSSPRLASVSLPVADGAVTRAPPSMSASSSPSSSTSRPTGVPIPPIPPAQNPRGELIFSSRVNPAFREGYERYRGEWERRRTENKEQEKRRRRKVESRGAWWNLWIFDGEQEPKSGSNGSAMPTANSEKSQALRDDTERGRNAGRGSVSGDSSRFASRANSAERRPSQRVQGRGTDDGEPETCAACDSTEPARSGASDSVQVMDVPSLAPIDSDDPSSTSTPPPQSEHRLPSRPSSTTATDAKAATDPSPPRSKSTSNARDGPDREAESRSHSRVRAESFSELLELEAANEDETEPGAGGPALTRSSSFR